MRAVIQRVRHASVTINGSAYSKIKNGLLILLGTEDSDEQEDIEWLAKKIAHLRIFNDDQEHMNLSLVDIGGQCLVISQFTLFANSKKGNRPSFIKASQPTIAQPLYEQFISELQQHCEHTVKTGQFGADMKVELLNDGPVTIIIDTKQKDL